MPDISVSISVTDPDTFKQHTVHTYTNACKKIRTNITKEKTFCLLAFNEIKDFLTLIIDMMFIFIDCMTAVTVEEITIHTKRLWGKPGVCKVTTAVTF